MAEVFDIALRFATACAAAYRMAPDAARKLYNRALFDRLLVVDGGITDPVYAEPLGLVFGINGFEQGSLELQTGACSNLAHLRDRLTELARASGGFDA